MIRLIRGFRKSHQSHSSILFVLQAGVNVVQIVNRLVSGAVSRPKLFPKKQTNFIATPKSSCFKIFKFFSSSKAKLKPDINWDKV